MEFFWWLCSSATDWIRNQMVNILTVVGFKSEIVDYLKVSITTWAQLLLETKWLGAAVQFGLQKFKFFWTLWGFSSFFCKAILAKVERKLKKKSKTSHKKPCWIFLSFLGAFLKPKFGLLSSKAFFHKIAIV